MQIATRQTAIIQNEKAVDESKNLHNIGVTLRDYCDPVVFSIYSGFGYNAKRGFNIAKIDYGQVVCFGGNLSIVLSPKITLDLGAEPGLN